jgi:iron complex outermembrane receptor protein
MSRKRQPGDARPPIRDYRTFDVELRKSGAGQRWEIAAMVRNLFNADARDPSPAPGLIPNDLPLPRRNWFLQLRGAL